MTKSELFAKADEFKYKVENVGALNEAKVKELDSYFRIEFSYSSNGLEGNSLSITEIKAMIEDGFTVPEKLLKEYYETVGIVEAYDYMLESARNDELVITEDMIKRLHYLFYHCIDNKEAGNYRSVKVNSVTKHLPPAPEDVSTLMQHFISQMEASKRILHPIEYAAFCHKRIMDIQPFQDGNGPIARLIMNMILVHMGYGTVIIPTALRNEYLDALTLSQKDQYPDIDALVKLIAQCVIDNEKDSCRLLGIN